MGWGDGNVRWYVILLSLMFVRDGVGGVGDGNVPCYVILLSLMFVWDGVGGVGDGNVPCYVILLSLMFVRDASFLCLAAAAGADCNGSVMVSRQEGHSPRL